LVHKAILGHRDSLAPRDLKASRVPTVRLVHQALRVLPELSVSKERQDPKGNSVPLAPWDRSVSPDHRENLDHRGFRDSLVHKARPGRVSRGIKVHPARRVQLDRLDSRDRQGQSALPVLRASKANAALREWLEMPDPKASREFRVPRVTPVIKALQEPPAPKVPLEPPDPQDRLDPKDPQAPRVPLAPPDPQD
jgi:hypothetical protein